MKKSLLLLSAFLLLTGCSNEESATSDNIDGNTKKEYTNKFECSKVVKVSETIERKKTKTYDFNKEGDKLIGYYEVDTYTYSVDIDMDEEKEKYNKKCDGVEKYGYTNCKISTKDNVITISKEADPKAEYNKNEFETITKESIKNDYANSEIYSCTED